MRKIEFDPPRTLKNEDKQWWEDWTTRAEQATRRYIEKWEAWVIARRQHVAGAPDRPPRLDEGIWTEFKNRLLKSVFSGKCGYCETAKKAGWPVQVEHYRPKGAVDGQDDHPGYFWLAYNWRNLIPCCQRCNSGKGKNTQFPVQKNHFVLCEPRAATPDERRRAIPSPNWSGLYYPAPEDLDTMEEPFLINPYVHDPSQHIAFGRFGVASGKTPFGVRTMEVLDLRSEDLRQERQAAQEEGFRSYFNLICSYNMLGETLEKSRELAEKKLNEGLPLMEYSAAVHDGLPLYWRAMAPG